MVQIESKEVNGLKRQKLPMWQLWHINYHCLQQISSGGVPTANDKTILLSKNLRAEYPVLCFWSRPKCKKKSWFLALKDGGQYPETALQIFLLWRFRGTTYSRLGLPWMKLLRFNRVGYFPKDCSSIIERRGNLRCKVIWDISRVY